MFRKRYAFEGCTGIKELHICKDINIWNYALKNCTGLEKVIIEDNVKYVDLLERTDYGISKSDAVFEGCTNLKYIYIGASFLPKVIEKDTVYLAFDFINFFDLTSLETIEVSPNNPYYDSVDDVLYVDEGDVYILLCYPSAKQGTYYSTERALKNIDKDFTVGWAAFGMNQNLKEVHFTKPLVYPEFEDDKKDLRNYYCLGQSFAYSSVEKVTFPKDGLKRIGSGMFEGSAIKEIDLSGTEIIMRYAFAECPNLTQANLPLCVDVASDAFAGCKGLKYVNLPLWTGETSDWSTGYVFAYCTALEHINIPNVEFIGEDWFRGCTALASISAPKCEEIGKRSFYQCTALKTVDMPMLSDIDDMAFYGCTNLESITYNEEAKYFYIGEKAFKDCTSLKNIRLGNIYRIKSGAFMNCTSLKNINLCSARNVGDSAFENCTSLVLSQFGNATCTFGSNVFRNCPNLSFYCEEESDAYNYAVLNNIPVTAISVSFQNDKYEYTGKEIEPSIIVSISGMVLTRNKDYTLTFEKNTEIGNAAVTVHFIGDFEGLPDAYRQFYIVRRNINSATVEYVKDNIYDGEEIRPDVVVVLDGKTLNEGVDYEIVYQNGTDTGTMLFTVKGKGNYTGTTDCYYNIIRRDIAEADVKKISDCIYTGDENCPSPVITWNGFTLVPDEDYEVRYFENINAGFATVVIYGKGNFCGTQCVRFKIFGKGIGSADVSEIPDMMYNGGEIRPDFTVTVDGVTLKEGTDYTAEYINNTEKGIAEIIISGTGNYSGVIRKTFNIYKNSVNSFTVFSDKTDTVYNGKEQVPEIEVYFGTERLSEGVDYEIRVTDNISAGTAFVTVTGIGRFEGERSYTFTIQPCKISEKDISASGNSEFNGTPVELEITVIKDGKTLERGKDYTVTYYDNNGVGKAYVTVEGIGNYCGSVKLEYEIYKTEDKTPQKPEEDKPSSDNSDSETDSNNGNVNNGEQNAENKPQTPAADKNSYPDGNNGSDGCQIPNTDAHIHGTSVQLAAIIAMLLCFAACPKSFRKKAEE